MTPPRRRPPCLRTVRTSPVIRGASEKNSTSKNVRGSDRVPAARTERRQQLLAGTRRLRSSRARSETAAHRAPPTIASPRPYHSTCARRPPSASRNSTIRLPLDAWRAPWRRRAVRRTVEREEELLQRRFVRLDLQHGVHAQALHQRVDGTRDREDHARPLRLDHLDSGDVRERVRRRRGGKGRPSPGASTDGAARPGRTPRPSRPPAAPRCGHRGAPPHAGCATRRTRCVRRVPPRVRRRAPAPASAGRGRWSARPG